MNRSALPLCLVASVLLLSGCTKAMRKERHLARADREYAAMHYDQAEVEYRVVLQYGIDPVAIRQLGFICFAEGRTLEAYAALQHAATDFPDNDDVQTQLAYCYSALGRLKDATDTALKVLKREPGREDAVLLLLTSMRGVKDLEDTRQLVEKLRAGDKDRAVYHVALGVIRLNQKDPAGAEREYRRALELDPKSASACVNLGNLLWLKGDAKGADEMLKKGYDLAPLRSNLRIRYAEFKLAEGQPDQAKKVLTDLTQAAPDYIPGWTVVMRLAFQEHRYDDCSVAIQKILVREAGNYDALLQRGNLKLAQGDIKGAIAELTALGRRFGRIPQLKFDLAYAYLRAGDATRAEENLNQAVVLAPNYDQAILLLAELNIRQGNPAAAVTSLSRAAKERPQIGRTYLVLAQAYLAENNLEQALAVYRRMQQISPKNPQVPYLIGIALGQNSRLDEARKSFETSLSLAPDYVPSLEMLVNLDLMQKKVGAASARVNDLVKTYPKSAAPLLLRAKVLLAQRNEAGAERDLDSAIELDPANQTAYLILAELYVRANRQDVALAKLGALADKTQNVTALMEIAHIQTVLKHYDKAQAAYERLIAAKPKFTPALNNLAYLYAENLGQLDKAYETAKKARDLDPNQSTTADTLGWILYRRGDYRGALALIEESADKSPADAEVEYHLGMTHYMLGEEAASAVALRRAVAPGTADFPHKDEASRHLTLLAIDPAKPDPAAESQLTRALKEEPNDSVALIRLAVLDQGRGDALQAAERYEAALKLRVNDTRSMLELAQLYSGPLHKPDRARELAKTAHQLAPTDGRITQTLGRLLYRTGDYQWSQDLMSEAARELPNDPGAQYELARASLMVGKTKDAEDAVQAALRTDAAFPQRGEAVHFASLLAAAKDPSLAKGALLEARAVSAADPGDISALRVEALAAEAAGDYTQAEGTYKTILARDPLFAPATRALAVLYVQHLNDDIQAADFVAKARSAFPDDPEITLMQGILIYRRAEYANAAPIFQQSLRQLASDPEATYYLGMCHFRLKVTGLAKTELKRALALNLSDAESIEAKRALEELDGGPVSGLLGSQPIN